MKENKDKIHQRFASLDERIKDGRVTRGRWFDGRFFGHEQGFERACLLLALAPEVIPAGGVPDATGCPAWLLPPWLAFLTPDMDDKGNIEEWYALIVRYSQVVRRVPFLSQESQRRLDYAVRAAILRLGMQCDSYSTVIAFAARAIEFCDRMAAGAIFNPEELGRLQQRRSYLSADPLADAAGYAFRPDAPAARDIATEIGWTVPLLATHRNTWDRINTAILDTIEKWSVA